MKKQAIRAAGVVVLAAVAVMGVPAAGEEDSAAAKPVALDSEGAKVSYAIGLQVAQSVANLEFDFDVDAFSAAIRDTLEEKPLQLSQEEAANVMREFQQKMMTRQRERQEKENTENMAKGTAFLEENLEKEGVKELPSGLQYKVIEAGTGKSPKPSSKVKCHYKGTLIDGTVFDSSYDRGEPAEFQVNRVIRGWQEALPMMKEGAKWQLFIPADLAYGERGGGDKIGPGETLIFDVELIEVLESEGSNKSVEILN